MAARSSLPLRRQARAVVCLMALAVATPSLGGCIRGDALRIATVAAVVAVKTAQLVAASSRTEARGRYVSSGGGSPRNVGACGACAEPENGYALCFISSCEVRCIEGYALLNGECIPETDADAARR